MHLLVHYFVHLLLHYFAHLLVSYLCVCSYVCQLIWVLNVIFVSLFFDMYLFVCLLVYFASHICVFVALGM